MKLSARNQIKGKVMKIVKGQTTGHVHIDIGNDVIVTASITNEAIDELKKHPQCDKENIAAIGYCFGGSTVQQLAFAGADLKAVASFHGGLVVPTADQVKASKAEILICNGADDKFIPDEAIKNFKESLDKNGGKYQFINYPGAVHSFTVPEADETAKKFNIVLKYNEDADKKSWAEMLALFKKTLGK
jgi:molybdopterin-binding protein